MSRSELKEEIHKDEDVFGLGCALELFAEHQEVCSMIDNLNIIINSEESIIERAEQRFLDILKQYHEQPHLLDSYLDEILEKMIKIIRSPDNNMKLKHQVFNYMYILINVRGYKVIVRHLPHEVADFEPVLRLLEQQNPEDTKTWMTRYVLLLWLSIIVMIPFHLSRLDGFYENEQNVEGKTAMIRVLDLCKTYAIVSDKCRDAAAFLASKFLTRTDVKQIHLKQFLDWARNLSSNPSSTVFLKYGVSSCVAMVIKHGKREDLLPLARDLLDWIIGDHFRLNSGSDVHKLVYKIVQRIGLIFLPPRIASWRYQRGNRSLTANLSAGDAKTDITPQQSTNLIETTPEEIDVPDEIEEIIDQLIQGLGAEDSIVRWSAAKGVGRVTSRLSKELADEVVGSVLELFNPRETDSSWHGGCLALAELGRRGLLLPERLPEVVTVIKKALVYDEPRGYSSVGSHIRDAACYVCWSFARAYETEILKPYVNEIAGALLIVACFDREINCRRAASAAFQENVGRQGTFPHGIDIIITADFFAISIRNNAYLNISVYIAQFDEYTTPLIDHLLERKVDHWDIAIRELTSKSLHNLTFKAPEYMANNVLKKLFEKAKSIDLHCRHGSVLAIGEIFHALALVAEEKGCKINQIVEEEELIEAQNLIGLYSERFYFRGLGGELMKQACSKFIQKCSMAKLPFHQLKIIDDWLSLLNTCLSYDVPIVRTTSIEALPALFKEYYQERPIENVVKTYINEILSPSCTQVSRMGHSLALGVLPFFIVKQYYQEIIKALIESTLITPATAKWAESRRDSIKALTSICVTLKEDGNDFEFVTQIFECFLLGLNEYTQDNRGDIGAWVREASMMGLETLTLLSKNDYLTPDLVSKILTGIAQQSVEKIDRTRALAAQIFYRLIYNEPKVPHVSSLDDLKKIFSEEKCNNLNWNSAKSTFPLFVQLLELEEYKYNVTLGLISSIGGLTETLVKNSSASFFEKLHEIKTRHSAGDQDISHLCDIILKIFMNYQRNDRIIVPMFRFLDKLFSSNCLTNLLENCEWEFPKKIFKLVQMEINGCKDIYKLIDGISLLCQYLQINSEICGNALVQLSILLCHRQPYIRRSTSTKLYESLLVYGDMSIIPEDNLEQVMNVLSSTDWEGNVEELRLVRNELCLLMGVRAPILKKK
ncbi:tubulin-specific chaperone D [Onthophagus taurus]|uniref:tubulin-specific chaperone D n=1 Tax=Onthophagus taurus TaxID=166361 RepID=UPI0039BE0FA7